MCIRDSYYIVVITSMTVVLVAKAPFGGYGHYPFNPSAAVSYTHLDVYKRQPLP